jgi:pimeloyl-ACP methyl ester carboxylesterase
MSSMSAIRPVRPIALLHAFPCDARMWAPQREALLARGLTVAAPDLPGFAGTSLPEGSPCLDVVADRVAESLSRAAEGPWTVAGVSLGGYVAMALLRRYPELVGSLVLCDTKATADADQARDNRLRLADLVDGAPHDAARVLEQAVLPGLLGTTTFAERPAVVEQVRGWLVEADPATVAWYQRAMAQRPDSRAVLAAFIGPAAIIWGEEDALSPWREQELMLEALPGAVVTRVPTAGHLANVECPGPVLAALAEFVAGPC